MPHQKNIVFVPGLLCTPALFAPQIEALAGHYRVHVADHSRHATLAEIARDILAQAPASFALAGLSMGGYVAFEMMRQAPDRITALALMDTNARADRPEQKKQREMLVGLGRTMGVRAVQGALLRYLVQPARLRDTMLINTVLDMADATGLPAFEREQAAIIGRPDNRPFLAAIRCPTVIIVGAQDALTPVKVSQEMHAGIAGSRLEVIPDCGHLATLERPEIVNGILLEWLAA